MHATLMRFPGEGRGPVVGRGLPRTVRRYIRHHHWAPAFAGEALMNEASMACTQSRAIAPAALLLVLIPLGRRGTVLVLIAATATAVVLATPFAIGLEIELPVA